MQNCQQIVDLVSQEIDRRLPWKVHLEIKMHLLMCKNCHRYAKQVKFMHSELSNIEQNLNAISLSTEAKERIQHSLQLSQTESPS